MPNPNSRYTGKIWSIAAAAAAVVGMVAAVWLDLATGLWTETVIISGIAAGLLTFVLTEFSVERWMNRRDHRNWLPVTRLALTDLLHATCDDRLSDIRRGHYVARDLHMPDPVDKAGLELLLDQVVAERDLLTDSLARWASFLAASADVQTLMIHLAALAESLDTLRDEVLEAEEDLTPENVRELEDALKAYRQGMSLVIQELHAQIELTESFGDAD